MKKIYACLLMELFVIKSFICIIGMHSWLLYMYFILGPRQNFFEASWWKLNNT